MPSSPQWVFDRFRLDLDHACLWRGAEVIALPPKAFDLLHYFVRHPDRVVTKDELLDAVWPQTAVTDAVVRVTIGLLRKVLGDTVQTPRFIATVARRGYRFLAPVTVVHPPETVPAEAPQQPAAPTQRSPEAVLPAPRPLPSTGDHMLESVPERAPLAYTPTALAEKIRTSRATLTGERKQITVLFADLKDSLALIRDLDPEAAQQLLDPALHAMMDAVHRYEGTVNQVLGDGIMALFGAPIAHEDHALRACYAALAMQAALRDYAEEVRRAHGLTMQSRIGLNSGEVVVRTIHHDLHMDYSAVGQTTHLAARMEQLASPDAIVLTAATVRLVEGLVRVKAWGPVPIKGLTEPVEVWELLGVSGRSRRLQSARARGLTHFVGRQTEMTVLTTALAQAGAGHGQVVAIVGEAGVGKSRLVDEFVQAAHTEGWLVLDSAAVSYGQATPYFPVLDLLRRYCHLEEHDDARTIQAKVTEQVRTLDTALHDTVPALLALLDALPEDSPFLQLDAPQRRQRTLAALKLMLLRQSQVQPLLLVCEDLHWLDTETQALLESLSESLPTARLLLLVNYRPDYRHGWGSKTYYTQVRLDPLPPASADAFLRALLGDDPSLTPLTQLLIQRTEGNPFFLEESVRALVETRALVGEPGAYRVAQALPTLQVPATVQAVLAARIDRLPPEEKRLLQTAAVMGTEVPLTLLQAVVELPEEALRLGLTHLQDAEFLYEASLFPELVYTFKHALTQEVAYGSLLQERRRMLHARIVEALEALVWRPGGRAGRTPGPPCPTGRGVGQGRDVLPAGRCQGLRPRRVPRGGGLLRPGPPGPRAPARARRHPELAIDLRLALGTRAHRTGRAWAAPRPVGRGRGPGRGARRSGPAGTGLAYMACVTQDDGGLRRRLGGGPAGPRSRGRARRERLAGPSSPMPGAGILCPSATSASDRAAGAEHGGCERGVWHAQYRLADPFPGVASADLEPSSGPSPRAGTTGRKHSASPGW